MKLVILLAVVGWCSAEKLDRTYLPPASAKTAGGEAASLQTPVENNYQPSQNTQQFIHSVGPKFSGAQYSQQRPAPSNGPMPYNAPSNAAGQYNQQYNQPRPTQNVNQPSGPSFNAYQPSGPSAQGSHSYGGYNQMQNGPSHQGPERSQAQYERTAMTIHQDSDVRPDGYEYSFETENGIKAQQVGREEGGIKATGDFSYTGDDGVAVMLTYEADENGYHPKGDHLPTPPPIPEAILRSIQQNAEAEANGIIDDGSYHEESQPSNNQQYTGQNNFGKSKPGYNYNSPNQPMYGKQVKSLSNTENFNNQPSLPMKQYVPSPQKYTSQQSPTQQYNAPMPYGGASLSRQSQLTQSSPKFNTQENGPTSYQSMPNQQHGNQPQPGQTQPTHQYPGPQNSAHSQQSTYSQQYNSQPKSMPNSPPNQSSSQYNAQSSQYAAPKSIPSSPPNQPAPSPQFHTEGQEHNEKQVMAYNSPQQSPPSHLQSSSLQGVSAQTYSSQNIPQRPNQSNGNMGQYSSNQYRPGQGEQFGGPRQPPSFSLEKGYQY